ncbi:MAG TPA: retroviral-like aspartic protease family protein [Candidatus Nanoarchaeia archaeon]|nr:retroviral-like aspartic protease family protein [Candidatus Nanoarchaeia archaeon]
MKILGRFLFGLPLVSLSLGRQEIEFMVDTGFNGQVLIPHHLASELGLRDAGTADYVTADGETAKAKVYVGILEWFGERKEVFVVSTNTDFSLMGMGLLHECRLIMERRKNILEFER